MDEKEKKQHQCDCEHEHDEHCECGCNDIDEDVVMLEDDDGKQIPFYHIATIDYDGNEYACLQQADDEDPIIEIFELQEVEEEDDVYYNFIPIEDDLYDIIYKKLEEAVAEAGDDDLDDDCEECDDDDCDDDCDDPDCECHHKDDDED